MLWSVRLGVRTPGFHPGNRGSIPLRTTLEVLKVLGVFKVLRVITIVIQLYVFEVL